jgi:uncharacterized protein YjbI with pentapeptide repeats
MTKDYSGQNLRGRSFKGENLEGANFSYADVRGADFTSAVLTGANFSHAKAGLRCCLAISLVIFSLLMSVVSVFMLATAVSYMGYALVSNSLEDVFAGVVGLIALTVFFILTIRRGLVVACGFLALAVAVVGAVTVVFAVTFAATGGIQLPVAAVVASTLAAAGALAAAVAFTLAVAVLGAVAGPLAVAVAVAMAVAMAVTFALAAVVVAVVIGAREVAVPTAWAAVLTGVTGAKLAVTVAGAAVGAAATPGLFAYVGWRALAGDEKQAFVRRIAVAIAAICGTSFHSADLTDADFTQATLKNTKFTKAILKNTRWFQAQKLHLAAVETTYLQNVQVRQLVVTGKGENKNFDRLDLRGLNLREANLENASFIDADLYKANLSNANLSRTILVRTNLEITDLRGACLTGSCIQDWNISRGTKLDGIVCDYVYLKWLDEDKRDQMPHRGKFKKGGFVLFAKYILDTIDIYHNKDIKPRLALTVLKKLSKDYDEPLDIVAVGKRGDKVFMKVKLSEDVEPEEFKEQYFSRYEDGLKLISSPSKQLPLVNELVENRLAEIASDETDEISNINITYVEYLNTPKDVVIQGEVTVETIETGGDTIHQSGSFGIGVNKGEVHAEKFAGTITENNSTKPNNFTVRTILILAANPKTTSRLRLDEEVREIDAGLQRAKKRELFDLKQRWAVRVQDVYQSLLDFKPQIVHFSGHGAGDDGLELEDETGKMRLVDTVALAELFKLFAGNIECVVFNACYSEVQAMAIAQHIAYVIGMNKAIGDKAAIKFATGFYNALGAGESVEFAYKLGCNVIQLDGIPEHLTPVLKKK